MENKIYNLRFRAVNSDKELREIYYSFPGYKEKIKKYGLIALELK